MLPSLTMANARITTPDPVTLDRVRLMIRGGVATATNTAGRTVWTAHLSAVRKTGSTTWALDLVEGGTATVVRKSCNCHG